MRSGSVLLAVAIVAMAGLTQAAILFDSKGFESPTYVIGNLNLQDNWTVGVDADGQIVNSGDPHGQVMQVTASAGGWGSELKRDYDSASTLQYLIVEMDFQMKDGPAFYFNDHNGPGDGGPESIFWDEDPDHIAMSNANPGIDPMPITYDTWYHIGIQVDQLSKEIICVNYDGVWLPENDTPDTAKQMTRMIFRSYGYEEGRRLWIDNLTVVDSDTPIRCIPEPATMSIIAFAGLLLLRRRSAGR
jgi:hypothetical protein